MRRNLTLVSAESGWSRRPARSQTTVAKYMVRHRKPPSQSWRTFLKNHARGLVSADFFVVPTITFQLLFVFVILDHDRRRPIHFAVTSNATAEWTAHQLLEAFPWDKAPRYMLRDRDGAYGEKFCHTAKCMGIREVLAAPRSPWQNPFEERLVGSEKDAPVSRPVEPLSLGHVMEIPKVGGLHHLYTRKAA